MRETISIQYLRAIAALMVVVYHTLTRTLPAATHGTFDVGAWAGGVDVFFVVSGFIMWRTTTARPVDTLAFWRARIIRIVPLYWAALAVYWLVLALESGFLGAPPAGDVIRSALFVPHRDTMTGLISPYLLPGWTLTYEMIFYAVFGTALFLPGPVARLSFVTIVFAALTLSRGFVDPSDPVAFRLTSPLFFEFVAGMGLAVIHDRIAERRSLPIVGAVALTAAAVFIVVGSRPNFIGWPRIVDFGVPAVLMVLGTVAFEKQCGGRPVGWLKHLGDASYSIYVAQEIFQHLAGQAIVDTGLPYVMVFTLIAVGSVVSGLLVHAWVEKPLTAKVRDLTRPKGASAPHPTPTTPAV